MQIARFDCTDIDQHILSGLNSVFSDHLGSIYTTFLTLQNYDSAISSINVGGIRWPGGTLAEVQTDRYGLTNPDIYNEDFRADRGLSDVLAYANANDLSFAMILPTVRYMNDVSRGVADVARFVERLLAGEFGELPDDFLLEIGNESSHVGWVNGTFTAGVGSYGYIANQFLTAINTVLSDPVRNPNNVEINVAVQMSTTVGGQSSIFSQISPENLRTVDGFVRHSGLVRTADEFDVGLELAKVHALTNWWDRAWGGKAPDINVLDTAWGVGPANVNAVANSEANYDIGVRHAAAVVETFSKLIASGSDAASIWGVQNNPSSMFYSSGNQITYGGHAFRMIAESLVGMTLVDGKIDHEGNWIESGTNWDSVTYASSDRVVIFVSAGDIADGGMIVSIDLQGIGGLERAWAEVISSAPPTNPNQVVVGAASAPGGPVISRLPIATNGSIVTVRLMNDYEVIRIIVDRDGPPVGQTLTGTAAADHLKGGNLGDALYGGAGNDTLNGNAGNDTMLGGAGNDSYIVDSAADRVFETSTLTSAADVGGIDIVHSVVTFSLDSHVGVRFIENLTLTGAAAINGTGNALANVLTGNAGNNSLWGGGGNDQLSGGGGNDSLYGSAADDALYGGAGNDTLNGGSGNDTMLGGAGNDSYIVDAAADRVFETTTANGSSNAGGIDIVHSSVTFTLDSHAGVRFVENLTLTGTAAINGTGNALANVLTGNAGDNLLYGGAGNDQLCGGGGNDALYGGAGIDTLNGDAGNDTMQGGASDDTYIVDSAGDRVFETTTLTGTTNAGGIDIVNSSVTFSLDSHAGVRFVENLTLTGTAAINGTGNTLANAITGNAGNNILDGGAGNDQLRGWGGNDALHGGLGNDALYGGAGNDTLTGGAGNDTMQGGAGADCFVFNLRPSATNVDRIIDFNAVDDMICLDGAVFAGLARSGLAGAAFASNLTGNATDALDRIIYESDSGRLYFDADGTGSAARVLFATLNPHLALTAADFSIF